MDRNQPAYWLSRDTAEAAAFLARTAVASRAVGGFVKTAQPPAGTDWGQIATNAAIGAGVGGLGGLGVGLFSGRKRNPLTTALTGAALGGVLGGAVQPGYQFLKGLAAPSTGTTQTEANLKAMQAQKLRNMSGVEQTINQVTGADPQLTAEDYAPKTPAVKDPLQVEREQLGYGKPLGKAIGEVGRGTYSAGKDILGFNQHPTAAPVVYGTTAGLHLAGREALRRANLNAQLFRDVQRGLAVADPSKLTGRVAPSWIAPPVTSGAAGAASSMPRQFADELNQLAGESSSPLRFWREARLGRQLGRYGASQGSIFAPETPPGTLQGLVSRNAAGQRVMASPALINELREAGHVATPAAAAAAKGGFGRFLKGVGMNALPYLGARGLLWAME